MKRKIVWCFILILFMSLSCNKEPMQQIVWHDYYPLSIGSVRIYECVSISIDVPAKKHDTTTYMIREIIRDNFTETNDCKVFAVNCEKNNKEQGSSWESYPSYSVQQHQRKIIRVEDNSPEQILLFPASEYVMWDLNEYNVKEEQKVTYTKINVVDTLLGVSYDSVLTVLQKNIKTLYTYQYSEEKYAKNIGMIYRKKIDVESQPNHASIDLDEPIETRITKGTITTFTLMDFGFK